MGYNVTNDTWPRVLTIAHIPLPQPETDGVKVAIIYPKLTIPKVIVRYHTYLIIHLSSNRQS